MQISQINNINFSSKQRFLNDIDYYNFQLIKKKIGKGSVINCGDFFYHTKLGYLKMDDVFFSNLNPARVLLGKSELEINDDGSLKILKKPFFRTKNGLMNKLGSYLSYFAEMFEQPNVVEKKYLIDTGYVDEQDGKVYITNREWINKK